MKKKSILILSCYIISCCTLSMAWWATGHELTAQIAKNNLTPTTLKIADKYLKTLIAYPGTLQSSKKTTTLITASTWCDVIKNEKWKNEENAKVNGMFHYINPVTLPDKKVSAANTDKAIKKLLKSNTDLSKYNCYTALRSSIKTMLNNKSSLAEKTVAFRFILHLVGDMHMPLHNAAPIIYGINTLGGNKIVFRKALTVPVLPPPKKEVSKISNIHSLWDSGAGFCEQLPYSFYPKFQTKVQNKFIAKESKNIIKSAKKGQTLSKRIQDAKIINWTIESNMLAAKFISTEKIEYIKSSKKPKKQVYAKFKNLKQYLISVQKVSKSQIYVGGMRLANLLNAIFDPQHADKKYVNYVKKISEDKNIPTLKKLFPKPIIFKIKE